MPLVADLPDADATARAGAAIARELAGGMVVTLQGELGAGKTTLVRGMLRALGFAGPVKSPTYGLVEHYSFSSLYFYHFDFYRLADPSEWDAAGFAECFRDDSVCVIEWPERVAERLPPPDLAIVLAHRGPARALTATAGTARGRRCEAALARTLAAT